MTTSRHEDLFGGEELRVVGETITAITLDSNVVVFAGAGREHEFRIENAFTVRNDQIGSHFVVRFDPYNKTKPVSEGLTELSEIIDRHVLHAKAYNSGVLELTLSGGDVITVPPKEKYEAWTYWFGDYILACPPGGFE